MSSELPYEKHTRMLLEMKRYREARLVCLKWVENQPANASAWFLKAFSETNTHQLTEALASIDKALQLSPSNPLMQVQRAQILGAIGHSKECLESLEKLLSAKQLPPAILHQVGATLSNIGEHNRAVATFEQVLASEPDNVANLSSLATSYHMLARSEEAAALQKRATELQPQDFRGYWLLGQMAKATPDNNEIPLFSSVLDQYQDKLTARVCLNFALAKQYEELEDFDRAFAHLQRGSSAVLEHSPYDQARDIRLHKSIIQAFDQQFCAGPNVGCDDASPLFIIGMPRTGTTLLEQIITTYEGIDTAGELHHFPHLFNQACTQLNPNADLDTVYSGLERLDWRGLGEAYIKSARLHVSDSPHFIDKYPLNFSMVGAILTALPRARIINLTRNPMDTCFSNYKLLYRLGTSLHSYDLETMADYYCRYKETMDHWHQCFPGRILDVSYESLVTNAEPTTQEVASFLDLPWRPECLDFYKAGGAVATASTTQVRQPINSGSLHKWRKFSQHLQPLVNRLQTRGISLPAAL